MQGAAQLTGPITRRHMNASLLAGAAAACAGLPLRAAAQGLGVAKILLGAPAGGSGDLMARRLADKLRGSYAGSVIVENKSGAGGQLAVSALRESPADGSVMLLTPSSLLSIYPYTYKSLPYKPETDLAPVSLAAYANMALAIGPGVPASVKSYADFLAWARANPDKASYGSPASGSIAHLIMVVIAHDTQTALTHVAYRGSTNALQDLRGGTLAALSAPVGAFLPHLKSGQLRLLAVSGDKRSRFAPEVPTCRELGLNLIAREWYGFFLPAKVGRDVVQRAATALHGALAQPDVAEGIAQFGLEVASSTPAELAAMVRTDSDEWRVLIKKVGFTAES